jgi:hypothetical protein
MMIKKLLLDLDGTYIPCNSVQFPNSEGIVP